MADATPCVRSPAPLVPLATQNTWRVPTSQRLEIGRRYDVLASPEDPVGVRNYAKGEQPVRKKRLRRARR